MSNKFPLWKYVCQLHTVQMPDMRSDKRTSTRGYRHPHRGQDLAALREGNLDVILRAIWDNAPVSRKELAQITGLAPSSITRLIQQLQQSKLIMSVGKYKSSGGRQPTLIAPNPDAGLIISLDLGGRQIRGGIFDASNQLISALEQPIAGLGYEAVKKQLLEFTQLLFTDSSHDSRKLLGLGVGVSGRVDIATGEIAESYNLQLRDFPIRQILTDAFHLPVYIEIDASVAALAEKYYGAGRGVDDFVYLLISTGIGAGVIMDGQIYRGKAGMPGEIGHIVVDRLGPICLCGRRGCLEAVASKPAILGNARRIFAHSRDPVNASLTGSDVKSLTLEKLASAAGFGNQMAQELINNAADHVAYAITTIATILNIRLIIVGGEVVQELGNIFFEGLQASLNKYRQRIQNIEVVRAELKSNAFLKGVSMLTLREILSAQK
jgi:N-acetylglucosamine repressor